MARDPRCCDLSPRSSPGRACTSPSSSPAASPPTGAAPRPSTPTQTPPTTTSARPWPSRPATPSPATRPPPGPLCSRSSTPSRIVDRSIPYPLGGSVDHLSRHVRTSADPVTHGAAPSGGAESVFSGAGQTCRQVSVRLDRAPDSQQKRRPRTVEMLRGPGGCVAVRSDQVRCRAAVERSWVEWRQSSTRGRGPGPAREGQGFEIPSAPPNCWSEAAHGSREGRARRRAFGRQEPVAHLPRPSRSCLTGPDVRPAQPGPRSLTSRGVRSRHFLKLWECVPL